MLKPEWPQVIEDLRSRDTDRAVRAFERLGAIADESRIAELYAMLNDKDFFIREAAAVPLARLEGVKALPSLFGALTRGTQDGHDNDGLVATVVDLLQANRSEVPPILQEMLSDEREDYRALAAWALGYVPTEQARLPLLNLIKSETSEFVLSAAAASLGSFPGDEETFQTLVFLLEHPSLHVKVAAIAGLGDFGDKRAEKLLAKYVDGSSQPLHFSAKYALENLQAGTSRLGNAG
jgi:HEAT repeat protein